MPPMHFQQLGDEPLYCEAVHNHAHADSDFYSGSEDDHYEAPLHRRLHIERKAIDFLSGNVPVLLSASLRGPFDGNQWNNPWRSTRAQSHAEPPKSQPSRSRQTVAPDEDLPDTQGTSLYPLPSPEITNPPSARKNPYMDELDYSRVKTWREAVKSTSVSKDPFWQSQQDDSDDATRARKRSADPTWLRKGDRKKRRSANRTNSTPDDSPSRIATQIKAKQTRQISAPQVGTRSFPDPALREDELATNGRTGYSSPNASPMANRDIRFPGLLRSGRTSPRRKTRFRQGPDTSEDELSLPATTPTSNAARHSTMVSRFPTGDRSPSRRKKATKSDSRSLSGREKSLLGRGKSEIPQPYRPSTSHGLGLDGASAGARTAAQMAEAALQCMDESFHKLPTKQSEPVQDELLATGAIVAKPHASPQHLATLPSTHQDDSFFFHKRGRSPAGKAEYVPPTVGLTAGSPPSPSSLQLHMTTVNEQGGDFAFSGGAIASLRSDQAGLMVESSQKGQDCPREPVELPRDPGHSPAAAEVHPSSDNPAGNQAQWTDGNKTHGGTMTGNDLPANTESDAANEPADEIHLRRTTKLEVLGPQTLSQMDGCAQSDSEWSTYFDCQSLTPASSGGEQITRNADNIPVVEYGVDGLSEPDWSTFVSTRNIMPVISSPEASVNQEVIVANIADHGCGILIESDDTTHVNIQSVPPVSPKDSIMPHECAGATHIGAISPGHDDQADNICQEATPGGVSQDANHFEASVGSIIDAYAEISVVSTISETSATEMPGTERGEMEAEAPTSTYPLPNQIATGLVDESDMFDESRVSEKLQQLQKPLQISLSPGSPSNPCYEPSKHDGIMDDAETPDLADSSGTKSQIPTAPENVADCGVDSSLLDKTASSTETPRIQSPWANQAGTLWQMPPQAPSSGRRLSIDTGIPGEAALQVQSPCRNKASTSSLLSVPPATSTSPIGSAPTLSLVAGQALATSQQPQSPWVAQDPPDSNHPTSDFEMSIKAFSDFMTPSPVKKRASFNSSILRCSSARSGVLFKKPGPQKPDRRVHFAPLPSEELTCNAGLDTDHTDSIYDEEEVSYFDPSGQKTGSMRLPKPTTRAASPPPVEMSSVEVGVLPDHDQKFAKHFEAMSKRKTPSRKSLRLLPPESQQMTSASYEVGAMAEAFIQASQTRRKASELGAEKMVDTERRHEHVGKTSVPVALSLLEDQENVEPVDDISAVLDNLDDFLDNTWGIEMGISDSGANEAQSGQEKTIAASHGVLQSSEDPMLSLEANVWAD
ncbi:Apoptosis-inducing factor 1 [Diaporthe australafricana]|uniref:Apoptosis-inducing factor 1 n=1 Tax=Diaporthe australafricana TaxID=127596 RepID=A0ABR3W2Q9_9PEZI